jgi:putative transposase
MQNTHQWEIAGEAGWGVALHRESVIRPLAEHPRLSSESIAEAANQLGLSRSILYKLLQRYRRRPQTSSLLPWKRGRKRDESLLGDEREALLSVCIDEFYLRPERPSLAALHLEVRRRFAQQTLAVPNYRTVRRRAEAVDAHTKIRRRDGAKKARELGPLSVSSLQPQRALEVVQIDHTLVDAIVVHRESRQPIGRPWLTLAVDVKTRMITGFHVSLWPPSALSVCLALTHAVLSKTSWLADRELQTLDWPASGLPQVLHVDNAQEFHSEALVRGCQEYGIHLDHRPAGQPHFGGHIERLIGTMMGAVHLLPGTTFSDVKQKGCYPSEARAILTISELERWLALQIAGVYHLSLHSSLGTTPLAAWQEAMGRLTDQQLADRFEAAELPAWENDSSFQQLLLSFESILPLRQRSEFRDPKVHQRILSLTEGILVRICRLLETSASEAIRGGQEHISLALLDEKLVAESLVSIVDRRNRRISSR